MPVSMVEAISPESARIHGMVSVLGVAKDAITISIEPHATQIALLKTLAYIAIFFLFLALVNNRERVQNAARVLVATGGKAGAAVVVRELWARECCMRRSFLAAGLWGVVDGLEARSAMTVQDAGTAISLGELADHADPDVAKAAGKARRYFTVEPPDR